MEALHILLGNETSFLSTRYKGISLGPECQNSVVRSKSCNNLATSVSRLIWACWKRKSRLSSWIFSVSWKTRWRPKWHPISSEEHKSTHACDRNVISVSKLGFSGSRNAMKLKSRIQHWHKPRWRPKWHPISSNEHKSTHVRDRNVISVSKLGFSGSRNAVKLKPHI